jgi:hypothetical protein
MGVFNKVMLCMALFLIIDQEGIGNTTLSEAFGHEVIHERALVTGNNNMESGENLIDLKSWFRKIVDKLERF